MMGRWWCPVLQGLFSAINVLGAIYALSLITPTNFAVMQPSIPVFTSELCSCARSARRPSSTNIRRACLCAVWQ